MASKRQERKRIVLEHLRQHGGTWFTNDDLTKILGFEFMTWYTRELTRAGKIARRRGPRRYQFRYPQTSDDSSGSVGFYVRFARWLPRINPTRLRIASAALVGIGTILFAIVAFALQSEIDDKRAELNNMQVRRIESFHQGQAAVASTNAAQATFTDMSILQLLGADAETLDAKREEQRRQVGQAVHFLTTACQILLVVQNEPRDDLDTASMTELEADLAELNAKQLEGDEAIKADMRNGDAQKSRLEVVSRTLAVIALAAQSLGIVLATSAETRSLTGTRPD